MSFPSNKQSSFQRHLPGSLSLPKSSWGYPCPLLSCSVLCTHIALFFCFRYKIVPICSFPRWPSHRKYNFSHSHGPVCVTDLGGVKVSEAQWAHSSPWSWGRGDWLCRLDRQILEHVSQSLRNHTKVILRHPCPSAAISSTPLISAAFLRITKSPSSVLKYSTACWTLV